VTRQIKESNWSIHLTRKNSAPLKRRKPPSISVKFKRMSDYFFY
jgi:hypothetical protein